MKKWNKAGIVVCTVAAIVGWLGLFSAGVLVNSKGYRNNLAADFGWLLLLKASLTFTPTNVAILSVLAGYLGGSLSLLLYADYDEKILPADLTDAEKKALRDRLGYLKENPLASALRGFVVSLTFIGGTALGANEAFAVTTQDQYCRLAGAAAILAFTVGFDPTLFRSILAVVPKKPS